MSPSLIAALPAGALSETAPAKLNLYLHVVGRRSDGYHHLDSLVAFTEAADRLRAEPAADLSLGVDGLFADGLKEEGDNIVLKAARALRALAVIPAPILPARVAATPTLRARDPDAGVKPFPEKSLDAGFRRHDDPEGDRANAIAHGARFTLIKNLPVASGIGGGSADAAAALRLLRRLWRLDADDAALRGIAATLGADVPVCLGGVTSFMGGVGEELAPAPKLPPVGIVLVNPRVPLITARVFQARNGRFSQPARFAETPADARHLAAVLAVRGNDLEAPAATLVPAILSVLDGLRASPGCLLARLSGSGATAFGLYESEAAASVAASWIGARERHWWVVPTRLRG